MSFAYKKIHPENITTSPYHANKQYDISLNNISGSGVTIYFGENISHDLLNYFDPENDEKTSNDEYKRFVFDSIKHLFYKNYNDSGSLLISSSYYDYPQTTRYSGTFDTNLRRIQNITGSSYQGKNSIYNDTIKYDEDSLYDDVSFDSDRGNLISVISIDKNLYGSNILPNTFSIIVDDYYIKDDGEGNIFDYLNESNYEAVIESGIPSAIYVGNIFYSLGIVVVTNQDYICVLGSPPTAINDYYTELNVSKSLSFDVTANDYTDCGSINYSSVTLVPIEGKEFPDSFVGVDGKLNIIENQASYIPGNYQIGYTVHSNTGLESNIGYINLNIIQEKLQITNLNVGTICSGTLGFVSYSFNIEKGVPQYSYSFDNVIYTGVSGFNNVLVSGSIPSNTTTLYVKDYINDIISSSLNITNAPIVYNANIKPLPSCAVSGGILTITSSNATYFKVDSDPINYSLTSSLLVSSGSHSLYVYSGDGCVVTSSFIVNNLPQYSYNVNYSDVTCLQSGTLLINNFQGTYSPNVYINIIKPDLTTSSYTTSSLYIGNLQSGSYTIQTYDGYCSQTSSVIIGTFSEMVLSASIDYSNPCFSNALIFVSGGVAPYTYTIKTPGGVYSSDTNNIQLYYDNLNPLILTASVIDNNGCTKTIYQEVYGREWIYSGSYCEND